MGQGWLQILSTSQCHPGPKLTFGLYLAERALIEYDSASVIDLDALWGQYTRIVKFRGAIVLTAQGVFTAKHIRHLHGDLASLLAKGASPQQEYKKHIRAGC